MFKLLKRNLKLLLLILNLLPRFVFADCNATLGACGTYVQTLQVENGTLKQEIVVLKQQRDAAVEIAGKDSEPPAVPTWLLFVLGAAVGSVVTYAAVK